MSLKTLRKTVERSQNSRDDFADGTVIRWTYRGQYTYTALKTPVGWVTSSRSGNVPKTLVWENLLRILSSDTVTNIAVATEWTPIGEQVEDADIEDQSDGVSSSPTEVLTNRLLDGSAFITRSEYSNEGAEICVRIPR